MGNSTAEYLICSCPDDLPHVDVHPVCNFMVYGIGMTQMVLVCYMWAMLLFMMWVKQNWIARTEVTAQRNTFNRMWKRDMAGLLCACIAGTGMGVAALLGFPLTHLPDEWQGTASIIAITPCLGGRVLWLRLSTLRIRKEASMINGTAANRNHSTMVCFCYCFEGACLVVYPGMAIVSIARAVVEPTVYHWTLSLTELLAGCGVLCLIFVMVLQQKNIRQILFIKKLRSKVQSNDKTAEASSSKVSKSSGRVLRDNITQLLIDACVSLFLISAAVVVTNPATFLIFAMVLLLSVLIVLGYYMYRMTLRIRRRLARFKLQVSKSAQITKQLSGSTVNTDVQTAVIFHHEEAVSVGERSGMGATEK